MRQPPAPSLRPGGAASPADDLAFFFLGNCQIQYFANYFHARYPGRVYVSGRPQVPMRGPPPAFLAPVEFYTIARRRRTRGQRNILIVQETTMMQFSRGVTRGRASAFAHVARIPFAHFRSVWPNFRLTTPMNFTVRSVRRLFETERLEFRATLSRAGAPDFDDDAYWSAARENLLFYHPGHPGGRLLFGLHEAFLAPMLAAIGEAQDVLRQATHAGCGLPLMSLHPIEPAWGDAVGCRWHIEPAYAGWALLRPGEGSLDIEAVAAARQDMADRFGSHLAAFFGMEAASLFAKQGDLAAAARLNVDAALTLTGQVKPLARALASATRAAAWVDVEDLLQANADYFHPPSALEPVILRWLKRDGELAEVREIIARVAGPLSHAGWLNTRAGSAP